jgi:hypothetical protein
MRLQNWREDGVLYWNGANISMEALAPRVAAETSKQPQTNYISAPTATCIAKPSRR